MKTELAKSIAQDALVALTGDPENLSHFLAATGASTDDVRQRFEDEEFLGFVLDFILMSDELVISSASAANVAPERIIVARHALGGGAAPNWT
ncbi:DUF3572 domain-containing protein [Amaricoccus macauensis]|uniref:DUF3572 domain-containing protein n=1 Tax=Amaricoccus macauensis TaxID=57001 RepID=UPI003C7BE6D8